MDYDEDQSRNELRTHAHWNALKFGFPFTCALIAMTVLYGTLATVHPGWALGPVCFVAALAFTLQGWRREFRGVEDEVDSGRGASFIFIAVALTLVGLFGPLALVP